MYERKNARFHTTGGTVYHENAVNQALVRAAAKQASTMLGQQTITEHTLCTVEQHVVAYADNNPPQQASGALAPALKAPRAP